MFNVGFSEQHHTLQSKSLMHNAAISKELCRTLYTAPTFFDLETPVVVTAGQLGQVSLKSIWPKSQRNER